ncbi:MAG TPA: hypothetical protein VFQ67_07350 [Allosphingosinicella sp.]|jgi:hypothetical protein|nr:hypothetical protein [Allosphingosinicella sp.]
MTVRIDEVVTDVAEEPPARRGDGGGEGGGPASAVEDLDRLEYELGRRRHRLARLWAD